MKNFLFLWLLCLCFPLGIMAQNGQDEQLAKQFFKSGSYQKASELYENLYKKYKSSNYYNYLFDCYIALNELDEAKKLTKKYSKKYKNNPTSIIDLGHIHQIGGHPKKANQSFEEALELIEKRPQYVATAANRLYKYQYFDFAIKAYKIGLRDPAKSNYHFQIARIYGQMSDMENMYSNYLELLSVNYGYLQSVKNAIARTISQDSEQENNILLKKLLLKRVQNNNEEALAELLIWLFVQEKNFDAAFDQEKSLDQKLGLNQEKVFKLASICRKNEAYSTAIDCYQYILNTEGSPYFLDAQLEILSVKKEQLSNNPGTSKEQWAELKSEYINSFNSLGKTSYTILLLRDLAQIEAFRLHDIESASVTIQEALAINTASPEDMAACKLVYADVLLLENEIWDSILLYSQVDKEFKHDLLGHEAKFRRAKISYYQGDFDWAQAQLDVLKASTSKLIANNAMELSLLIQDNLNLDTTTVTMQIFARADLLIYQNKLDEAYTSLDSIIMGYQGHSLIDECLFSQYEIRTVQDRIEDAAELLEQIIQFYSFDILADDAKYALAKLQENYFRRPEEALKLYQDIITNHQDSFFLAEARKRFRILRGE